LNKRTFSDTEKIEVLAGLSSVRTDTAALTRLLKSASGHWPALFALADENHVSPLIAKNLAKNNLLETLPSEYGHTYSRLPRSVAARNMLLSDAAREILDSAAARGIDILPVKGITFIGRICEFDERQLSDVDFFFRPPQLPDVEIMMADLGYNREESALPAGFADELSGEIKFTSERSGAAVPVEFHWDPAPAAALRKAFDFSENKLWQLSASKDGRFSLTPEGEFIYHIFHLAVRHSCSRLQWFIDLDRLSAAAPPDWDLLVSLLRSSRLANAAGCVFRFMEKFLGSRFPVAVSQLTSHSGENGLADRLIAASIAGNKTVKQSGLIPIFISERKAVYLGNYLFPPAGFLEKRYPGIPTPLAYLYRPWDIATKILKESLRH
jgi:hypothetical protein